MDREHLEIGLKNLYSDYIAFYQKRHGYTYEPSYLQGLITQADFIIANLTDKQAQTLLSNHTKHKGAFLFDAITPEGERISTYKAADYPQDFLDKCSFVPSVEPVLDIAQESLSVEVNHSGALLQLMVEASLEPKRSEIKDIINRYLNIMEQPSSRLKMAEANGAITTINNYDLIITDKLYRFSLSPFKNNKAYIQQLDEQFIQQMDFDPINGTMYITGRPYEKLMLQDVKTRSNLKELDLPLLRSLYNVIYTHAEKIDKDTVTIYLPTLARHLGINIRGDKPNDLFKKIRAFENVVGILGNGSFYRLLAFIKYDQITNTITFASPYMNLILRQLQEVNIVRPKKGREFLMPHYSYLVHSTIANEKNKPAIELTVAIVTLLHQRGTRKDKKCDSNVITVHKRYRDLIKEVPILDDMLFGQNQAKHINTIISRAFTGAYKLLKEKTDVYDYYIDLQIPETIPTVKVLDDVMTISHNGVNSRYKVNFAIQKQL